MDKRIERVLDDIRREFAGKIKKGARHYLEVNIGRRADRLGFSGLSDRFRNTCAMVPLRDPQPGMKVRIDGRTFVHYAEHESGIAVPGFLVRGAGTLYRPFLPRDSMVCNFT